MESIIRNCKPQKIMIPYAAATTERKSDSVNTTGLDSVAFFAMFGTITSGGSCAMTIQGSDTDVDANYVNCYDQTNTLMRKTILDGDDNKVLVIEAIRPRFKYLRMVLTPAVANVVIDYGMAIAGVHQRTRPPTRHSSMSAYGYDTFIGAMPQAT